MNARPDFEKHVFLVCVCVCVCVHTECGGGVAAGGGPTGADEEPVSLLPPLPADHDQPPREIPRLLQPHVQRYV